MSNLVAVTFTSEEDAKAVLDEMLKILPGRGFVTRSDYLELVGIAPSYLDARMAWDEPLLKDVQIKQVGEDEYLLDLPKPKLLT